MSFLVSEAYVAAIHASLRATFETITWSIEPLKFQFMLISIKVPIKIAPPFVLFCYQYYKIK